MNSYTFEVKGLPQPKGSARAFIARGRPVITSANPKAKKFAGDVRSVLQAWPFGLLDGGLPVSLDMTFVVPRPKSVSERRRPEPTVLPDVDKLARTVLDALAGIVYRDDAQVVEIHARKAYGQVPGLRCEVCWP